MPVTTRSRKRQLQEAQDTGQPSSAKESKISKPEDPKVHSSVVADSEDIQQKKCQKGEEKLKGKNILKRLPCEMICHIFRYLPDKDLFNQMLSDRFFEKSAGYVLQRRKLYLSALSISFGISKTFLRVETGTTFSVRIRTSYCYDFKVENAGALYEGYEKKGSRITSALYLLFNYYNSSAARVTSSNYYCYKTPLTLETFFGPSPNEPLEKIKINHLSMNADAALLLRWFCPTELNLRQMYNWSIQVSQQELQELIVGIDKITSVYSLTHNNCVDQVMEACDAKDISIGSNYTWSYKSILSVVKANASCDNKGATRTIKLHSRKTRWKKLFGRLMNSCEENPTDPDVEYTIKMPKCTFEHHGSFVKFILH